MPNYQNGKIYTIRSYQTEKFYIGSTCEILSKRLYQHSKKKNECKSKEIINYGDAYIELLELYPCNNKDELNKREGELIRDHKDQCCNRNIPFRTKKEYYQDNYNKIKEYRNLNKEKNKEYQKEYYHTIKKPLT
jgi:tagatose-1,6-bisphosphate aldolase